MALRYLPGLKHGKRVLIRVGLCSHEVEIFFMVLHGYDLTSKF
jgi:hypothetical protein